MRAAVIYEWQDRAVVEEYTSVTGAAGPHAVKAGERYHDRREISAAIDGWCVAGTGVIGVVCLMHECRRRVGTVWRSPENRFRPGYASDSSGSGVLWVLSGLVLSSSSVLSDLAR